MKVCRLCQEIYPNPEYCGDCDACTTCCECDADDFDADELGLDPEERYDA